MGGLDFTRTPPPLRRGEWLTHKPDEVVVDAASAKELGYHVGERIPVGWETNA